jgi:hypothetical protein
MTRTERNAIAALEKLTKKKQHRKQLPLARKLSGALVKSINEFWAWKKGDGLLTVLKEVEEHLKQL